MTIAVFLSFRLWSLIKVFHAIPWALDIVLLPLPLPIPWATFMLLAFKMGQVNKAFSG